MAIAERYDAIVIGGGISGLASAALLSAKGFKICLLEKEEKVGGSLYALKRDGHVLQGGAHHIGGLGEGEQLHVLLDQLGLYDPQLFIPSPPLRVRVGQEELEVPFELKALENALYAHFPAERFGLSAFFAEVYGFKAAMKANDRAHIFSYFQRLSRIPYEQYLKMHFRNPLIGVYLSVLGPAYGGVTPKDNAFTLFTLLATYGSGAYYVRGGAHHLAGRLKESVEERGGTILTGTRVKQAVPEGRRLREVYAECNGEDLRLSAPLFVSAGNFPSLYGDLKSGINNHRTEAKLAALTPGPAAFRLFICLSDSGIPPCGSEYIHLPSWRTEEWQADLLYKSPGFRCREASRIMDPIATVSIPTMVDPELSPGGGQHVLMTVLTQPGMHQAYRADESDIDRLYLTELLHRRMPELELDPERCWLASPHDLEQQTGATGGAVFGWGRDGESVVTTNVIGPASILDNLYVVGNWGPSFGVFGSVYSASEAVSLIAEQEQRSLLKQ